MAADAPFQVLSDSTLHTLQYLLHGLSYGIYPIFSGYVLSCPGAAVTSIMELLRGQFGQTMGEKSFKAPLQNAGLASCQLRCQRPLHSHRTQPATSVSEKLLYDFLADRRVQYGFPDKNLHGQEIMTVESFPEVGQLYPTKDLDFRPQAARTAIGTLVTCAITSMRQAMLRPCRCV